jgi:uncharacterized protein YjdB
MRLLPFEAVIDAADLITAIGPGNYHHRDQNERHRRHLHCDCDSRPVKVTGTSVNGVTGVTLNKTSDIIAVGATDQLTATVQPSTATVQPSTATDQTVTWNSDTPGVATVSSSGLVTGVAVGTANITATTTDGSNITSTCAVTVNVLKAQSNEQLVVSAPATAVAGAPFSFTVTAEPAIPVR